MGDFNNINPNPIVFLMKLGHDSLEMATTLWMTGFGIIALFGLAAGFCSAVNPGAVLFTNLINWAKPLILGIAGALIVPGVILGYYLPLYPYIVFTFGTIGWIMLVLEGMVAAPLVCFGLAHPDGHDFLGKAEQAVMLFLGVFLRPVLMVIGLISAMIVSYVALRLLVFGFAGVINDIFNQTSTQAGAHVAASSSIFGAVNAAAFNTNNGNDLMNIIVGPSLLVIFATLVYTITQQCFSLIHVLPDNIMQWIGGPQKQDGSAQMARQIEGAASSAGKTAGDLGGQAIMGGGEAIGRAGPEGKKTRDNLKGKSGDVSSDAGGGGGVEDIAMLAGG